MNGYEQEFIAPFKPHIRAIGGGRFAVYQTRDFDKNSTKEVCPNAQVAIDYAEELWEKHAAWFWVKRG